MNVALRIIVLILTLIISTQSLKDHKFLLINQHQKNGDVILSCVTRGNLTKSAIGITGPLNDDIQNATSAKVNIEHYSYFKHSNPHNGRYLNLPPVLDEQWEDFPLLRSDEHSIEMNNSEYLWISMRKADETAICLESDTCVKIGYNREVNTNWIHFQVFIKEPTISLKYFNTSKESTHTIKLNDKYKLYINGSTVFKIHSYKVHVGNLEIVPKNRTTRGHIDIMETFTKSCVEYTYYVCPYCTFEIYVTNKLGNNMGNDLRKKVYFSRINPGNDWQTEIIELEHKLPLDKLKLSIITEFIKGTNSSLIGYWVFRNIKECKSNTGNINDVERNTTKTISNKISYNEYKCETIKQIYTLSLKKVYNNINSEDMNYYYKRAIICDLYGDCYCSNGSRGDKCQDECADRFWGNCSSKCECCTENEICDKMTGACKQGNSYFVKDIEVESIYSDNASILYQLNSNCLSNDVTVFQIQYKINSEVNWTKEEKNSFESFDGSSPKLYKLHNLTPKTIYNVRVVLCSNIKCYEDGTEIIKIHTSCLLPEENDINLIPTNKTIEMELINKYSSKKGSCDDNNFLITKNNETPIDSKYYTLTQLQPFTEYNISIWHNERKLYTKHIRTLAGKPGIIKKIVVSKLINSHVILSWDEPKSNGNIKNYDIQYLRIGSVGCNYTSNKSCNKSSPKCENAETNFNNRTFEFTNLVPYSQYIFFIKAKNQIGYGKSFNTTFKTLQSNKIDSYEIPNNIQINHTHLQIVQPECDKIKGPSAFYRIKFQCQDEWCINEKPISLDKTVYFPETSIQLVTHLTPYTRYKVLTTMSRLRNSIEHHFPTAEYKSLPECPPELRNFEVYSKSNSTVSLRWKLPYPSYGVIKEYKIKVNGLNFVIDHVNVGKCNIWADKDLYCWNIEDRQFNGRACVEVTPYNYNVSSHCNRDNTKKLTNIVLKEERSEPPLNLMVELKNADQILNIKWNHPDKTNGNLTKFIIMLKKQSSDLQESMDIEEKYIIQHSSYQYEYNLQSLSVSTTYNLSVTPFNTLRGVAALYNTSIITPPPIPMLLGNLTFSCNINRSNCRLFIPPFTGITTKSYMLYMVKIPGHSNNISPNHSNVLNNVYKNNAYTKPTVIKQITTFSNTTQDINVTKIMIKENITAYENAIFEIQVIVVNKYEHLEKYGAYMAKEIENITSDKVSTATVIVLGLVLLLIILFIIGIGIFILWWKLNHPFMSVWDIFKWKCLHQIVQPEQTVNYKDNIYENQDLIPKSNVILKDDLFEYLLSSTINRENCELYEEFNKVPIRMSVFSEIGMKKKNKNRYNNIIPYEETRVLLRNQDYINASYVDGYLQKKAYIATQGPKVETINDFWNMVHQQDVKLIAMLANIKENDKIKCDQYWPDYKNPKLVLEKLTVEFHTEIAHGDYIERHLNLNYNSNSMKVIHLQYISWPDYSVPENSQNLCEYLEKFNSFHDYQSPAIVHCSAGAGRTGTFILCDIILRMVRKESKLDFHKTLYSLRMNRINLVQTQEQYHLAHVVIFESLFGINGILNCNDGLVENVEKIINSNQVLESQLKFVEQMHKIDVHTFDTTHTQDKKNSNRNRSKDILPSNKGAIYLETLNHDDTVYINAVYVDGYKSKNKFIVTQQPLPTTIDDFWTLVCQKKPCAILSMEEPEFKYYPSSEELKTKNNIEITFSNITEYNCYNTTKLEIKPKDPNEENFTIDVIQLKKKISFGSKDSIDDMIEFYNGYRNAYAKATSPVLVTCLDGATYSGIFVTLDHVVAKTINEQIYDVLGAIRTVRKTRSQFISNKKQLIYVYSAALRPYFTIFLTNVNIPM